MAKDINYRRLINSTRWRMLRNEMLAARPLCEDCTAAGRVTGASEVHHIVPVETGRSFEEMHRLAYSPCNLACLCHECHKRRHIAMRKGSKENNRLRRKAQAETFVRNFYREDPGGIF